MIIKNKFITDLDLIKQIISDCKVVRIGMCIDNIPCVIPLNYGFEFDDKKLTLYCYSIDEEKNLDILMKNPNVFIEIDNSIISKNDISNIEEEYFSIMSEGKAEFVDNIYDKIYGLQKIIQHHNLNKSFKFKNEIINKVNLIKITCNNLSIKNCTL